jgi:hypothetical protein
MVEFDQSIMLWAIPLVVVGALLLLLMAYRLWKQFRVREWDKDRFLAEDIESIHLNAFNSGSSHSSPSRPKVSPGSEKKNKLSFIQRVSSQLANTFRSKSGFDIDEEVHREIIKISERTAISSQILTDDFVQQIMRALPKSYAIAKWERIFCTEFDGYHLMSFYNAAKGCAPTVLVIRDSSSQVRCVSDVF